MEGFFLATHWVKLLFLLVTTRVPLRSIGQELGGVFPSSTFVHFSFRTANCTIDATVNLRSQSLDLEGNYVHKA